MRDTSKIHQVCAVLAAGALLTASGRALSAESTAQRKPLSGHVDAGYVMTDDKTSNFLDDGGMVEGGLTWRPGGGPFGLRADLRYLELDTDKDVVRLGGVPSTPIRIDDGDARIVGLNLGGVYNFDFGNRGSAYITAGLGPYYRDIELTQTALFSGIACDPFFGTCFSALVPGEVKVAENETTRLGWSVGLGVEYPLRNGALFLEAHYLRIQTDEPTELIPVQIGFRF